jgi:hypothetical protein
MKKLLYFLMISILFLASCEKDEEDKGCVKEIVFTASSSFVGVTGSFTEAAKYKYLVIGETPNVSEATGVVYCDSAGVSANFSIRASSLFSNTKYYLKVFYRDASGKSVYSAEYTVTTKNNLNPTSFGKVTKSDTLIDGKELHQISYFFMNVSDYRDAEFGVCYCKATYPGVTPVPTVTDKVIKGTINKDGTVSCDISEVNFNEMENVRPYFKNSKETVYGPIFTYSKPSWLICKVFPGNYYNYGPGVISYKGKGYMFLGGNSSDMWSFNSKDMSWSKEVSLSDLRVINGTTYTIENMKAAPISNGFLFFKGGDYSGRSFNRFFTYNTADKTYTQILPNGIPDNVYKYSWECDGFGMNGQAYVAMYVGYSSNPDNDPSGAYIYAYDEASRTFTEVTANRERLGVDNVACFVVGNMVFMGAGSYTTFGTSGTTDFWSYNASTKEWTRLKDAPISKFVKSFVYKNRCFAIGSDKNLYEYSVGNDSWKVIDKVEYTVEAIMPFDDGLYLFAGNRMLKNVSL